MKKKILILVACLVALAGVFCGIYIQDSKLNNAIETLEDTIIEEIQTYEMSEEEIIELASTEIIEQTEEQENAQEQEVEDESFELQGEIAYEGDRATTWDVELGDYIGLTYYSQLDSRWSSKMYSSVGNTSQTIGSSGCGSTCAAMVVTATKGTITPDTMSDLFVKYGYRSANSGTYWSAFRAIADEFNIGYTETTDIQKALQLLESNYYVVSSCGNGLFTTGGHFIMLTKVENGIIEIYDPYLYSGKFDTSTRRGKVTVDGNTVYCSVDNFINYANAKGFFCYEHDENVEINNTQTVTTATYTRYVNTTSKNLNVRNEPNGTVVGSLAKGTQVTVYETSGDWSRIGINRWVSSSYLASSNSTVSTSTSYTTGKYKVTADLLNVRTGAGMSYSKKTYTQLTANARKQNKALGNYYAKGYLKGVVCTVTQVKGNWGKTASGWICLDYCTKQ